MAKVSKKRLEIQKAKVTKSNKGGEVWVFVGFRVCKGQREGFLGFF
jgi:hypothetical protein